MGDIIVREGRILFVKRGNEPEREKWSIPGGLFELRETLEQAVTREVKEETGLEVESSRYIDIVENIERNGDRRVRYHYVIVDYVVRVEDGEPRVGSDAVELRWVPFDKVEEYGLTRTFGNFVGRNIRKSRLLRGRDNFMCFSRFEHMLQVELICSI